MSSFAPSPAAAQAALGQGMTLERRGHPKGAAGVKISLEEVAAKIREGRLDPRVRAWAGKALIAAGRPQSVAGQSQALLSMLRKQVMYVADPVDAEFIASAKNTLCLDEHGLCIVAADCDDLVVALGSALLSIGIVTKIIGQSFDSSGIASHVILAVETGSGWKRIDPSSDKYEVGQFYPATKEQWIDPLDSQGASGVAGTGMGEFIGIGLRPGMPNVVFESDIQDLKNRVHPYVVLLDTLVSHCPSLPEATRLGWQAYSQSWHAYNDTDRHWYSTATSPFLAVGLDLEQLLPAWQNRLRQCGDTGPVFIAPHESQSSWPAVIKTVAVAGALIAGAIVARPIIEVLAQRFKK